MIDPSRVKGRRKEDVIAGRIMHILTLLMKIGGMGTAAFMAGMAGIITLKNAWIEMVRAFIK